MTNEIEGLELALRAKKRALWKQVGRLAVAVLTAWSWLMFALAATLHWSLRDLVTWGIVGLAWSIPNRAEG